MPALDSATLPEPTPEDFTRTVELIDRYAQGDRSALDRLFRRYFQRVRVVVASRLPQQYRSVVDVEDVVQRTFEQAFKNVAGFEHRTEGSFMRWITTIAINECRAVHDYMNAVKRGSGRNPHVESIMMRRGASEDSIGFDPAQSGDLPAEVVAQNEQVELLLEAIQQLSERHREVILLRDYQGLAFRDVASEMSLPTEGAASMLHTRARVALGRLLRGRGEEA